MIWLTWRQYRTPALVAAAVGAVVLAVLLLTGPRLAHDYTLDGLPTCVTTGAEPPAAGGRRITDAAGGDGNARGTMAGTTSQTA
jgi:hypothetical protein